MKLTNIKPVSLLAAGIALASAQASFGQTNVNINDLAAVGGNNTQQSAGTWISDYLTDYTGVNNLSDTETELLGLCNDYANEVNGTAIGDVAGVAGALELIDFLTHEEVGALGSGLTDTGHDQMGNILGRLQSLRSGTPGIASANSINLLSGGAAGMDFSKLSYFVNLSYGDGEKDRTRNEQGFDFDSQALTLGVDYRFKEDLVGGVALSFGQSDIEVERNLGGTESDTFGVTFYGSYYQDNWYLDASLGFSQYDYDSVRNIPVASLLLFTTLVDQRLTSSTEGDSFNWSIGGGITQDLKGWDANYSLRLDGVDATIDGYNEGGGSLALKVADQDVESLQAVVAAQFSKAFSQKWGVISPYFGVELHQEFDDETRVVTAQYVFDRFGNQFSFNSDDADDSYFLVSVGSSFVLSQGKQLFVNLDHIAGLDDVDSNTLTAGIRFEL